MHVFIDKITFNMYIVFFKKMSSYKTMLSFEKRTRVLFKSLRQIGDGRLNFQLTYFRRMCTFTF